MRILIIGEYSAFSENLRKGFQRIGHFCYVFSWGDVFKEIPFETNTYLVNVGYYKIGKRTIRGSRYIRRLLSSLKLHFKVKKLAKGEKFDFVLIINPAFLKTTDNIFIPCFSKKMVLSLVKNAENIYLSACGNDYVFNSYLPFMKKSSEFSLMKYYDNIEQDRRDYDYYSPLFRKVIPFNYDYAEAYRMKQNIYNFIVCDSIPLPYDTEKTKFINEVNGKIKIMHGISRVHEKGSVYIVTAMNMLKERYPEKVELLFAKHLTLSQYLQFMREANILVDQCYGCGYGMNAIEALAMGKVVLSGNEPENQKEMNCYNIPIVNITPNVRQIYNALEILILNPDRIKELSISSRKYAEEVHNCSLVAQKYADLFENC